MTNSKQSLSVEELAVMNVANFARFASGRLAEHMVTDLKIVVELAQAALRSRSPLEDNSNG